MSKALVQRSLELFGGSDEHRRHSDKRKKKKKKKKRDSLYQGALELIPARHRFTSKEDKALIGSILGRSGRTTLDEARKRLATQKDPTEENVQRLLSLETKRLKPEVSNKLLQRAVKKRTKKQEKSKEPEKTAFTEEDFKKFEQEYMK